MEFIEITLTINKTALTSEEADAVHDHILNDIPELKGKAFSVSTSIWKPE